MSTMHLKKHEQAVIDTVKSFIEVECYVNIDMNRSCYRMIAEWAMTEGKQAQHLEIPFSLLVTDLARNTETEVLSNYIENLISMSLMHHKKPSRKKDYINSVSISFTLESFIKANADLDSITPTAFEDPDTWLPKETIYVISNTQEAFNTYIYQRDDAIYIRLTEALLDEKIADKAVSIWDPVRGGYTLEHAKSGVNLYALGTVRIITGGIDSNAYHAILKYRQTINLLINLEQVWGI